MFGGNTANQNFSYFLEENPLYYDSNSLTQMQLFGNNESFNVFEYPCSFLRKINVNICACNADPIKLKVRDNNDACVLNVPIKRSSEIATQNNLQISFNILFRDEMDRSRSIPQVDTVSTGLRLSYDDEERHSSVTTTCGSMSSLPLTTTILGNLRLEIKNQNEELNRFLRFQEEQFAKGLREMMQRHVTSFKNLFDQELSQKLRAKDMEIESINRKNCELADRIHQALAEAQTWQQRAQYNESILHALRTSLQQAVAQGAAAAAAAANLGRECCGENEVDVASSSYPNSVRDGENRMLTMACKGCEGRESCMVLLPCRHLCLCRDCVALVDACPVCFTRKTASVEVYMS